MPENQKPRMLDLMGMGHKPESERGVRRQMVTLRARVLSVVRTEDITPRMRRVFLSGEDLEADFPFQPMASSDHIKLVIPEEQSGEPILPTVGERGFIMPEGMTRMDTRTYTVRGFDPEKKELSIDFVLHDHGIAGSWAMVAQPGDKIGVLGPRGHHLYPTDYSHYIIIGDETALPAVSRLVEELPSTISATVVVEVDNPKEDQKLHSQAPVTITWIHRSENEGESTLAQVVRTLSLPEDDNWFVFAAGEAGEMKDIRHYFRRELSISKERLDIDGYWKKGITGGNRKASKIDAD